MVARRLTHFISNCYPQWFTIVPKYIQGHTCLAIISLYYPNYATFAGLTYTIYHNSLADWKKKKRNLNLDLKQLGQNSWGKY